MVLTVHRWFANKSCPGNWMYARMGDLAEKLRHSLAADFGNTETEHPEKLTEGYRVSARHGRTVRHRKAHTRSYPTPRGVPTATQVTACSTITGSISTRRAGCFCAVRRCGFLVQVSISDLYPKGPENGLAKTGKFVEKAYLPSWRSNPGRVPRLAGVG